MSIGPSTRPLPTRQPLGLPAGSIRAALAIQIVVQFWLLLIVPEAQRVPIPLSLYFLLALVFLMFVSHGPTNVASRPWGVPTIVFRLFVVIGTIATIVWQLLTHHEALIRQLTPDAGQLDQWVYFMGSTAGGFIAGWLIRHGPWRDSPIFMDLQAWAALMAMLGMFLELLIRLFINPGVSEQLNLFPWECVSTFVVSWYFGSRG